MVRRKRLPEWLKKRLPAGTGSSGTEALLESFDLATVCQSAKCPNKCECFGRGVATFMILGDRCTRDCGFCGVLSGTPNPVDDGEPGRLAQAAKALRLSHVVITSVTRDDLPDGGASQFAASVDAVRGVLPDATIEVLVPDFQGNTDSLETVLASGPEILNHNLETVPRLYPVARPDADYRRSLGVLKYAKAACPTTKAKSGMMLGLGETVEEVLEVFRDLRAVGCDMLTVGQYLQPGDGNLVVDEYVPPERFREYEEAALDVGFVSAYCGPFVRSSYHAGEFMKKLEN